MGQAASHSAANRHRVVPGYARQLQSVHVDLAGGFAGSLSALLRSPVMVSLVGVEPTTYGRFAYDLETPACFYVLKTDPLDERLMLDVDPAILYPMIDRLLGGGRDDEPPPDRPLSEVEQCLAARIVRSFLDECSRAWRDQIEWTLDILQVETNPRLMRILPTDDPVMVSSFEATVGGLRGLLRLCMPCRTIDRMNDKTAIAARSPSIHRVADPVADVRVVLAQTQITAGDLASLRVGDIVATETPADRPATVSIDGVARFYAKPGAHEGRKAVCLGEPIKNVASEPT